MLLLAAALTLPWTARLAGGLALGLGARPGDYQPAYYALERLSTAADQPTNGVLLVLAAIGLALAWRRGAWPVLGLALWAAVLVALANPYWWPVPLPVAGRIDLVTVLAALCFPLAVAAAYSVSRALRATRARWPRAARVGGLAGLGAGTLLGAWQLQTLVTPSNTLVGEADLAAAAWLRATTPPDARVAVNTVLVPWAPDYVVGIDGGYWLPLLAGRATTALPMLYPGERGVDPGAAEQMVRVARALRDAPAAPETVELLRAAGVAYLYHSGRPGTPPLDGILSSGLYPSLYERDGVRVLAVPR
jgi:hypothetical protein